MNRNQWKFTLRDTAIAQSQTFSASNYFQCIRPDIFGNLFHRRARSFCRSWLTRIFNRYEWKFILLDTILASSQTYSASNYFQADIYGNLFYCRARSFCRLWLTRILNRYAVKNHVWDTAIAPYQAFSAANYFKCTQAGIYGDLLHRRRRVSFLSSHNTQLLRFTRLENSSLAHFWSSRLGV